MSSRALRNIETCDVAICGAGLAGLTLALQLKRQIPAMSVLLLDRLSRPLPEAAFKVGESTVETGSHYFRGILDLGDYLEERHIRKLGLRFFFEDGQADFRSRPEFGLRMYPSVPSYQLDRGILENDLRRFAEEAGVVLLEGHRVQDIVLAGEGDPHTVHFQTDDGESGSVRARWVVDAMGRRRFLQKRLDLRKDLGDECSSVWFRLSGRVDVTDLVPREETAWHARVAEDSRYPSTNHLMGRGYWVWIIPLASGHTSVGIVALEDLHDFGDFNTYERAHEWLQRHEPVLAAYLEDRELIDFRCMRRYSYGCKRLFSHRRWASVGEAALFPDPFYSLGTDLIGLENTMVTDLIRRDREGSIGPEVVDRYNDMILALGHWITNSVQGGYPFFGNGVVMANKIMWDTASGWATLGPLMFNGVFLEDDLQEPFKRASGGLFFLTRTMQDLFADWANRSSGRLSYDFIDFLSVPVMKRIQTRNLRSGKTAEEIIRDQETNLLELETMAQAIFLVAVEDILPEHLDRFDGATWLDAWALSLDPDAWEPDGLFQSSSTRGDLRSMRREIRRLFRSTTEAAIG